MRVLKQLTIDDSHLFPATVPIVESSIYIDDTLFDDKIHELRELRDQLIDLMKAGGFHLRNCRKFIKTFRISNILNSQHELADHLPAKDETLKILGLSWLPREDTFCFVIAPSVTAAPTRRSILSFIAKLYDSLAASVVIAAKILLQELWLLKGDWNVPIRQELVQR